MIFVKAFHTEYLTEEDLPNMSVFRSVLIGEVMIKHIISRVCPYFKSIVSQNLRRLYYIKCPKK